MPNTNPNSPEIDTLFAEPVPFDRFLVEVLDALHITQQELAEPAGISQTVISNIIRRKTASPFISTIKKIRRALIEEFGIPAELATMDYFIASRTLLEPRPADTVDSRFAEIDEWLNTLPNDIQEHFWNALNGLIHLTKAMRNQ